jgi:hypothetical protein
MKKPLGPTALINRLKKFKPAKQFYPDNFATMGLTKEGKSRGFKYPQWYGCRESFLRSLPSQLQSFAFSHKSFKNRNIAAFLAEFQDRMKLPKKDRVVLVKCDRVSNRKTSFVYFSDWWKSHMVRRQLLTILLRCGAFYDPKKKNFDEALKSVNYSRNSLEAIQLFIEGYTTLKEGIKMDYYHGWNSRFWNLSRETAKEFLTIPKK